MNNIIFRRVKISWVILSSTLVMIWCSQLDLAQAADSDTPTANSMPLPCDTSMAKFQGLSSFFLPCGKQFGACKTGSEPNQKGYIPQLIDMLIRDIVGKEMNDLYYKGVDTYTDGRFPKQLRPANFIKTTSGKGNCATMGACNLFCGEGNPNSKYQKLKTEIPFILQNNIPLSHVAEGFLSSSDQGQSPNHTETSIDPDTGGQSSVVVDDRKFVPIITGMPTDLEPWKAKVNPDFMGNGPISNAPSNKTYVYNADGSTSGPAATPAPDSITSGWPSFNFQITDRFAYSMQGDGGNGACVDPDPNFQTDLSFTGFSPTLLSGDSDGMHSNDAYMVQSLSWLDATWPSVSTNPMPSNSGGYGCSSVLFSDYSQASAMASLHTGVFVQALWVKLQEVVNEIKDKQFLNLKSPVCKALADKVTQQMVASADTIYNLNATKNCEVVPLACEHMGKLIQETDPKAALPGEFQTPTADGHYEACELDALLLYTKNASVEKIAVCEVYERAMDLFDLYMYSPPAGTQADIQGQLWVDQLRNFAVSSCMIEDIPYAKDYASGFFDSCNEGCWYWKVGYPTVLIGTPRYSDVRWEMDKHLGSGDLTNCFPYAYTAAFSDYLSFADKRFTDTGTVGTLSHVAIQGLGEASVPMLQDALKKDVANTLNSIGGTKIKDYVSPSGAITITGCQMTDHNPSSSNEIGQ